MEEHTRFWELADDMVARHRLVSDRPAGTCHPRHPDVVYPLDYGYLDGTSALDGDGIDCWRGSLPEATVSGVIVTVDSWKNDSELKWPIGCTREEMQKALATYRTGSQAAMLLVR